MEEDVDAQEIRRIVHEASNAAGPSEDSFGGSDGLGHKEEDADDEKLRLSAMNVSVKFRISYHLIT